jgi:hypothetical protein
MEFNSLIIEEEGSTQLRRPLDMILSQLIKVHIVTTHCPNPF